MLRRIKDLVFLLLGLLLLGGLGGFAWLTNHPDAEIVDEAVYWPVVGPLAEMFRERFRQPTAEEAYERQRQAWIDGATTEMPDEPLDLAALQAGSGAAQRSRSIPPQATAPPPVASSRVAPAELSPAEPESAPSQPTTSPPSRPELDPDRVYTIGELRRMGNGSVEPIKQFQSESQPAPKRTVVPTQNGEMVRIEHGTRLYAEPDESSELLREVKRRQGAFTIMQALESRDDWHLVNVDGVRGWMKVVPKSWDEVKRFEPRRTGPISPRSAPSAFLVWAHETIGEDRIRAELGPHKLSTDVEDAELIAYLDTVAGQVEALYRERFDRKPRGLPRAHAVLFSSREDYQAFLTETGARGQIVHSAGVAMTGMLAFYRSGSRDSMAGTVIHEMTHMINRRAIGPGLPSWLEEGLAETLATSALRDDGTIVPDQWARRDGTSFAGQLLAQTGGLPPLRRLLSLDQAVFVSPLEALQSYALAGYFVRFLLDGEDGRYRKGFLKFLDATAGGTPASITHLERRLDASVDDIEPALLEWIKVQTRS
ncbi:MAG: hypothetical protein AAGD38_17495 [Acidobacteriota bacterium]